MARLDVYQLPGRTKHGHVVDVQADLLSHLSTRVVVPLLPISEFRHIAAELNPVIRSTARTTSWCRRRLPRFRDAN